MSANTKFVRGGTSGINGTALKDGQILFNKDKKVISLDIKVNNQLVRIEMDGPVMEGATSLADGKTGTVTQPLIGDRDKYFKGDGTWATPTNTTTGDGLKMKVAKTGTAQSSITNTLAANTTMDNAIGTLLNNDATIANQKLGDFVSVSDVTVDSVTYHTYWIVAPTSSNQVYGIAIHPTNGRLYRIYNNEGTYSVTAYDANDNTKVTQTASTGNSNYEVLFSNTADNTTRTEATRKNSNLKFNPSTGNLQTTQLNGVNVGSSPAFTDTRDFKLGTTRNGATDNTLYFIYST